MAANTSRSMQYAAAAAERYLARMSDDPHMRQDALTKVIIGAMIEEFQHCKKHMCPKCQASYSKARREGR